MKETKTTPHDFEYSPGIDATFVHPQLDAASQEEPLTCAGQQFYKASGIWHFRNIIKPLDDNEETRYSQWLCVTDPNFSTRIESWFKKEYPELYITEEMKRLRILDEFLDKC